MPTRDIRRSRGDTSSDQSSTTGTNTSSGGSSGGSSGRSSFRPPPSPERRDDSTAGSSGGSSGGSSPPTTTTVSESFTPPPSPERRDTSTAGSTATDVNRVDASEVSVGDFQQFSARNPVTADASQISVGDMQQFSARNRVPTQKSIDRAARTQAAASDPLRDADDFVANVDIASDGSRSVDVRRRNRPFFERQRQALGFDTPEESRVRGGLRDRSQQIQSFFGRQADAQDERIAERNRAIGIDDVGIDGGPDPNRFGGDLTRGFGAAVDLPGAVDSAAGVAERGANIGQARGESSVAQTTDEAGVELPFDEDFDPDAFDEEFDAQQQRFDQDIGALADVSRERPGIVAGALGTGVVGGAGAGFAIGRGGTAVRDSVRTAGARELDFADITNPSTRRAVEGGDGDPFPPVRNQELAETNPAAAIRQQSDEFTPEALERGFEDAGAPVGPDQSVMFRAVDTEPTGPGRGRADQGLETFGTKRPFDPPGGFVAPELSPRFLRVEPRSSDFSPVPGLPDLGGRPTAVGVRTRVRDSDSDTLPAFIDELEARSGETDAFTRPDFSMGEAEAVIPPGSEFQAVSSGGLGTRTARSLGIGSDFSVNVAGRQVPLRTVADIDGRPRSFLGDTRGQTGGRGPTGPIRSLDEFSSRPVRQRTDRPAPGAPVSSAPFGSSSSAAALSSSSVFGSDPSSSGFGDSSSGSPSGSSSSPFGGSSSGSSLGSSGGTTSGSTGSTGGSSSGFGTSGDDGFTSLSPPTTPTGVPTPGFDTPGFRRQFEDDDAELESEGDILIDEAEDQFGTNILSGEEAAADFGFDSGDDRLSL